jgi:hypothetical protein
MMMMFKQPYELEEMPPRVWVVDGKDVLLSRGWRLVREELRNDIK